MTKYVVKGNHPFIKEGVIISDKELTTERYGWLYEIDEEDITCWLNSEWIEEIQKPLFTTEDGKDIYVNDMVWFAENDNTFSTKARKDEKFHDTLDILKECKAFSTEEAAKKYIDQNKLKFSEVDMIKFAFFNFRNFNNRQQSKKVQDNLIDWIKETKDNSIITEQTI